MKYAVVNERGPISCTVRVPDLPGCVAIGGARNEALHLIREAIELHVQNLAEHGDEIQPPSPSIKDVHSAAGSLKRAAACGGRRVQSSSTIERAMTEALS